MWVLEVIFVPFSKNFTFIDAETVVDETFEDIPTQTNTKKVKRSKVPLLKNYCYDCKLPFVDKYGFKRHVDRIHLKKKPAKMLQCSECDKKFRKDMHL